MDSIILEFDAKNYKVEDIGYGNTESPDKLDMKKSKNKKNETQKPNDA